MIVILICSPVISGAVQQSTENNYLTNTFYFTSGNIETIFTILLVRPNNLAIYISIISVIPLGRNYLNDANSKHNYNFTSIWDYSLGWYDGDGGEVVCDTQLVVPFK